MQITKKQEIEVRKIVDSFLEICHRAIREDPKNPRMNAQILLPGLEYIQDLFSKEINIHE